MKEFMAKYVATAPLEEGFSAQVEGKRGGCCADPWALRGAPFSYLPASVMLLPCSAAALTAAPGLSDIRVLSESRKNKRQNITSSSSTQAAVKL